MHKENFDVIVIGGGATGAGIALDATLRGFKCLLLEKNDFAEGTSSRSTKLVHGGVRYLEAAVKKLDKDQYDLVKEGLKERYILINNAPHLAHSITLVTPLYKWFEIPYIYAGLVLYDLVSGKRRLGKSQIVSRNEIMKYFPTVKREGLKGGVRYFDGAFNDARMVVSLLQSAKKLGCVVKNYQKVEKFIYDNGKISGVEVTDTLSQEKYTQKAKIVVNATGAFCDKLRLIDDENAQRIVEASSGIHIILDKKFLPNNQGLMIPKTEDGRVLFMLPWMDKCLVGTTDEEAKVVDHPEVHEKDVEYLLRHMRKYFDIDIQKSDILSSWCGLRPLVSLKHTKNTKEVVREHYIETSKTSLISIAGGKWTTYRKMSEDAVDIVQKILKLEHIDTCKTEKYKLLGSHIDLQSVEVSLNTSCEDKKICEHLLKTYGAQALDILEYAKKYGFNRLDENYDIIDAEIYYTLEHEFVKKPLDFVVRRVGLGLIDINVAKKVLIHVSHIMCEHFAWSKEKCEAEIEEAFEHLNEGRI